MQVTPATAELIEGLSGGSTFETDDLSTPTSTSATGPSTCATCSTSSTRTRSPRSRPTTGARPTSRRGAASDLEPDDIEFEETRDYVDNVLEKREEYREHYADELGID